MPELCPNSSFAFFAEPANLGETVEPLLDFIGDLAKNGAVKAPVDYGFRGWVAHHNTDRWAMTTMATGDPAWAAWPMGGIWLAQSLWERYAFGLDQNYLRRQAWPLLRGASEFALDLLVPDQQGRRVTSPSTSPENHLRTRRQESASPSRAARPWTWP